MRSRLVVTLCICLAVSLLAAASFSVCAADLAVAAVHMDRWRYGLALSALGSALMLVPAVWRLPKSADIVLTVLGGIAFINWLLPLNFLYSFLYLYLYDGMTDLDFLRDFESAIHWVAIGFAAHGLMAAVMIWSAVADLRRGART